MIVVLDAEVLRRDPLRKRGAFRALQQLCEEERLSLCIPWVALEEFRSARGSELDSASSKAESALRFLGRKIAEPMKRRELQIAIELLETNREAFATEVDRELERWLKACRVRILDVSPEHGQKVLEKYFQGSPPFRSVKERDDFPDAFIWESVVDLCQEEDKKEVVLVTADNGLDDAAALGPDNLRCVSSLENLLEVPALADALRGGVLQSQLARMAEAFHSRVHASSDFWEIVVEAVTGREVGVQWPVAGNAAVTRLKTLTGLMFEPRVTYYGEGRVEVPFSARATALLEVPVDQEKEEEGSAGDTIERTVIMEGKLLFTIVPEVLEKEVGMEEMRQALEDGTVGVSELVLWGERGTDGISFETVMRHVEDEVNLQLARRDFRIDVDPKEEEARLRRAVWHELPDELVDERPGGFTIRPEARVKIAPLPRFENLVRVVKKGILQEGGLRTQEDAVDGRQASDD